MAYATFPTLAGRGWPEKVTPRWNTVQQKAASGARYNTSLMSSALHDIEVPVNYLSATELSTLQTFFNTQLGAATPFYLTATNGSTYLVTFADDTLDFNQLMNQMYQTGTIKFTEFR